MLVMEQEGEKMLFNCLESNLDPLFDDKQQHNTLNGL